MTAAHPFVRAAAESAAARLLFSRPGEQPRLLVALSGGPDSCALLLALCEGADAALWPRPVAAAHFHHGLRGEDADEDAAFAAALCARLAVPCAIGLGSVRARGRSPNAAARTDRYEFLAEAAREAGADVIVTAHTADDQAETVLLRVLRGASVDGLAAMPPVRDLTPDLRIARPLLALRRADVEAYCRDRRVTPRRDPSNEKDRYARARLRRRLPELARDFNPRLTDALVRLSEHASADADLLGRLSDDLWQQAAKRCWPGISVRLDAGIVAAAHSALRRRVLLRALLAAYGPSESDAPRREEAATAAFVARLEGAALSGSGVHDLPGGVHARAWAGLLALERSPAPAAVSLAAASLSLSGVARVTFARLRVRAEDWPGPVPPLPPRALEAYLDRDAAAKHPDGRGTMATDPVLVVRAPRVGDRIAPLGMGGRTRLVRDVMADAGWEIPTRAVAALVTRASDDAILWVVGLAQSEETRVSEKTRAVVRLSADFDC